MKNNLFYYATSELSQDAFICWLVSFAYAETSPDPALTECAKNFLSMLVPELDEHSVQLLSIEQQVGNRTDGYIDVLLTVSCNNKIYKIIVEDKTFSDDHDNQLERYLTLVQKHSPEAIVRGAYYKTGFQSDLKNIIQAGYVIVDRKAMLDLMAQYITKTQNTIFIDYYTYWNNFHEETLRFQELPIAQWNWKQTNGFYSHLSANNFFTKKNMWSGFGYVANQMGGFDGLWFGADNYRLTIDGVEIDCYLQLETYISSTTTTQLCLKLSTVHENTPIELVRNIRNRIVYGNNGTYTLGMYHFKKPARLGSGRSMTIGIYSAELTDYTTATTTLEEAVEDYKKVLTYLQTT